MKMTKRTDKNMKKIIAVVLASVLVVLISFAVMEADTKYGLSKDFTAEQMYSLGESSKEMLGSLETDVVIYALFPQNGKDEYLAGLLEEYAYASPHIEIEDVDPVQNPGFVETYRQESFSITDGSIIVTNPNTDAFKLIYAEDLYLVDGEGNSLGTVAEQKITSAIAKVISGKEKRALFLTGHNEMAITLMGGFLNMLDTLNYDLGVHTLDAPEAENNTVLNPEADVLMVVNPLSDLTEGEAEDLRAFLSAGGKAFFFMGNAVYSSTGTTSLLSQPLENFEAILLDYGITVQKNYIINEGMQNTVSDRPTVLLLNAPGSGYEIVAGEVSGMQLSDGAQLLLQTQGNCYAKEITQNFETLEQQASDAIGPFDAGALSQSGNVCVFSFSSIVTDSYIDLRDNRNLLNDCLNTLSSDDAALDVPPKYHYTPMLNISSMGQFSVLVILVLVLLPFSFLAVGIYTYRKRRKL